MYIDLQIPILFMQWENNFAGKRSCSLSYPRSWVSLFHLN